MDKNEINDRGHIAGFDFEEHELILADGFEDCVVGIVTGFGESPKVCYDRGAMIEELMSGGMSGGMSGEDAEEYFGFNVEGAYVGPGTPCFLHVDEELFQRLHRPGSLRSSPESPRSIPDTPRRDYAKVVWRVEDVTDLAPEMTEDEASDFLERNERHIAGRICEIGYQVIEDYLGYEALESGGADEEPGSGGEEEG